MSEGPTPIIAVMSVADVGNGVMVCLNEAAYDEGMTTTWLRKVGGVRPDIAMDDQLLAGKEVAANRTKSVFTGDYTIFWTGDGEKREVVGVYGPQGSMGFIGEDCPDITNYRMVRPMVPAHEVDTWTHPDARLDHRDFGLKLTPDYIKGGPQ